MSRKSLSTGGWFDLARATRIDETRRHDGRNYISNATGSQWDHEALYCSAAGTWILHSWSDWQGSTEEYGEIAVSDAADWLIRNGLDLPASLIDEANSQEM